MATGPAGKRAKKGPRASAAPAPAGKTIQPRRGPGKVPVSRQVRREVPSLRDLTDDSAWTIADVVALLANGMPQTQEERNRRDRARKRLRDHLRRGLIEERTAGVFNASAVVTWIQQYWPKESVGLPAPSAPSTLRTGSAAAGAGASTTSRGIALRSYDECREKVAEMAAHIIALERDLVAAREEVRELKSDAQWARQRKAQLAKARAKK
jgi:outer membrane murein-binding lipoprotein Lpp